MTQFARRGIQVCFGCVSSQQQKCPKMQFWEQHLYKLGSYTAYICFSSLGTHQRRRETSWGGLVLLCIISINVSTSFLSFWGSTQVCSNAPETWQKLFCRAAWGKGGKEAMGRFHLVSSFRTKTFAWVTVPIFKSLLTTWGSQNSRVCVQDRRKNGIAGSAEEQDAVLSAHGMRLLEACGKHSPRLGRLLLSGRGGERGSAGHLLAIIWQSLAAGARAAFPGAQLATAGPSRQPGTARPPLPKALPERGRAAAGALPSAAPVAGGEPRQELPWSVGAARMRPRLKSQALIKLMACLACNLSSWVSTSLWSNRFT